LRFNLTILILIATHFSHFSQENKLNEKSNFYLYWGWNGSDYTKSDISFVGENYNFNLENVVAKDRQTEFSINTYFNPVRATIPQYNFRIGYFFKPKWDISFGIDHMKYVVVQNQKTLINGFINDNNIYDGFYINQEIAIKEDFLKFEHTDGLNYANIELRYSFNILEMNKITINLVQGFGAGLMVPKTNTTLIGKESYDEFHLSGYGTALVTGINLTFFNNFFIQSELKGGYINLPNIRTTEFKSDKASHQFFFSQFNILFGGIICFKKKSNKD
jgi:hypothetical protein